MASRIESQEGRGNRIPPRVLMEVRFDYEFESITQYASQVTQGRRGDRDRRKPSILW